MNEDKIKAKGWDDYSAGVSSWSCPYKERTWRALAWQEGYNAAEKEQGYRMHRRSWDSQGQYGAVPSATLPAGSSVYPAR